MPSIHCKTYIAEDPDVVFRIVSNTHSLSQLINGVGKLSIIAQDDLKRISEWNINVNGTPVHWKEEQIINPRNRSITFRMIEGDYSHYDGEWRVSQKEDGSELEFRFNIEWNLETDDSNLKDTLERKARLAARWALREIRSKIGVGKIISATLPDVTERIISEPIKLRNLNGAEIIGFYDHLEKQSIDSPTIILMPGYGETKRESLLISFYLARNSFNVIRYDATNHVGESSGEIFNTTMDQLKNDLVAVINYASSRFRSDKICVFAVSLSFRVALKATVECPKISFLMGLVGVVNLQSTLLKIYREDIIGDIQSGKVKNTYEVLGFVINNNFPIEAILHDYHDLNGSIRDIKKINVPVVLFSAENDSWIDPADSRTIANECKNRNSILKVVPNAMHQLTENPAALKNTMKDIVATASRILRNKDMMLEDVIEPMRKELAVQNRAEKDRLKSRSTFTSETEQEFWDHYLTKYSILSRVPDYNQYLKTVVEMLTINKVNLKILDAGCGNGYLGAYLISHSINSNGLTDKVPLFSLCSIDRSEKSLSNAKYGHDGIINNGNLAHKFSQKNRPVCAYRVVDLNSPIDNESNFFDRICSSLVLSYLDDPIKTLKELIRVLKPGGLIVVSSIKPQADLSQIYRDFLDVCKNNDEIAIARELLNEAGKIKQKEGEGRYRFFSETELKTLLIGSHLENIRCIRSFGNQANIAVACKPELKQKR